MNSEEKKNTRPPIAVPSKRSKTSISVDREEWLRFGAQLRLQGIDYSDAINVFVKQFLEGEKELPGKQAIEESTQQPTRRELHQLLDEIIDNGTSHIAAIQQNLELLAFACHLAGSHSLTEIRALRKKLNAEEKLRKKTLSRTKT